MKKVLIAGGSGLIGQRLTQMLREKEYEVYILSRKKISVKMKDFRRWDPMKGEIDLEGLSPDIIINLAGAGIADKRWTKERKSLIVRSRTSGNALFRKLIESNIIEPECYISASAVGIYGDRGDSVLDDEAEAGDANHFLVDSCLKWEESIRSIKRMVDRMILIRTGIVLSKSGGALAKMLPPLKMGAAGYFGNGTQFFPWIHIDDLCRAYIHCIENPNAQGIYNGVSPNPATMKEFMSKMKSMYRPWAILLSIPAGMLKTVMGEMSSLFLFSQRVKPSKLTNEGFQFLYPKLESALKKEKI